MGYVESNLLSDERIIEKAKIHWAIFVFPVLFLLLALFFALITRLSPPDGNAASTTSIMMSLVCIWSWPIIGIILLITSILVYFTTEFALTNKRIIAKLGILNQHSLEILINNIESIGVNQPILGRILDYGTITVVGSGGTRQSFTNISTPMKLRQNINIQIASNK